MVPEHGFDNPINGIVGNLPVNHGKVVEADRRDIPVPFDARSATPIVVSGNWGE